MPNLRLSKRSISGLILATYSVLHATVLLSSPASQAAEYHFQPSIALMAETDDNVLLSANEIDIYSLQGESATLNADFSRNQINTSLSFNNQFSSRKFDLNRYNSEDVSTTINYQRSFERGTLSLNLSASDESIRTLENQFENDGSTEQRATKARTYSFAISGQRQLTEQQFFQNQFSVQQRDYDSDNRTSYDFFSNSLLWVYSINSGLSLQANLSLSSFQPEKTDSIEFAFVDDLIAILPSALTETEIFNIIIGRMNQCLLDAESESPNNPYNPETAILIPTSAPTYSNDNFFCFNARSNSLEQDTINLQLGLQYQWTENLSLNFLIGRSQSETVRDVFDPANAISVTGELTGNYVLDTEQNNLSYSADISYQHSASITTKFSTIRAEEQTAYGISNNTSRFTLSNKWQINPLTKLNINISRVDRDQSLTSINQTLTNANSSQVSINYHRKWKNYFNSEFSYVYGERGSGQQLGTRNRFMITLSWQPQAFSWLK